MGGAVFPSCYLPGAKLWWASLVAQKVNHLPAVWETRVLPLSWEDPLEKEMATHSFKKISFHSSPKERQCQRMLTLPHNYTHITH